MRSSIAVISALVAVAAAGAHEPIEVTSTLEVTITSCGPDVPDCPATATPAPEEPSTIYSTVDVTITSCPPEGENQTHLHDNRKCILI